MVIKVNRLKIKEILLRLYRCIKYTFSSDQSKQPTGSITSDNVCFRDAFK